MKMHAPVLVGILLLLHVVACGALAAQEKGCANAKCSCLPDDETWHAFNVSVGGRLLRPRPSAAPCHCGGNPAACLTVVHNWHNPYWRSDQPGAMQVLNAESNGGAACILPTSPTYASCTACDQGAVSAYAVRVSEVAHVQAAIHFAAMHNLRLTIKSTGHDSMGRSTAPSSLNIWMHHLKNITFHDEFMPEGCAKDVQGPVMAVTVGAGVQWNELYEAVDARQRVVVGAMSGTVSAAGGYMQGGGHSPLSPLLGLAADNVIELKVVTAYGRLKTANACQNKDLFWALRGGGGGTFGVVMSATHRIHPALRSALGVEFTAKANSNSSFKALITMFVELQASLSESGFWAGYAKINFTSIVGNYLLPNMSSSMAAHKAAVGAFKPIRAFADAHPNEVSCNLSIQALPSFLTWHRYAICKSTNATVCSDATGFYSVIASRLLPKELLKNNATEVASAFIQILSQGVYEIIGHLVGGRAVAKPDHSNSVNPAWRKALWHVILLSVWTSDVATAATVADKMCLVTRTNRLLRELTPHSGCYVNEADFNEPHWEASFFGGNFERLSVIKKQVDPHALFSCWKCVGSQA